VSLAADTAAVAITGRVSIIGLVPRSCRANNYSLRDPVDTAFMAQEMGPVEELPVACTLGPGRGEEQLRRWRALEGGHLLHRSRQPDELVVRYRADEASRREITELRGIQLTGPSQVRSLSMVGQLWAGPDSVDVRLSRAAWG